MIRSLATVALAAFLLAPAACFALTLKPAVVARGEVVRAGDFFDGLDDGAEAPLFRAPRPGTAGVVSAHRLVDAVARLGHAWSPPAGLTRITVRRPAAGGAFALPPEAIVELIAAALVDALPAATAREDVRVDLARGTGAIPFPADAEDAEVAGIVLKPGTRRFTATLAAGEGEARRSHEVAGSFELDVPIPVLASDVTRGDIVTRAVLTRKRLGPRAAERYLTSEGEIAGLAARRPLRAGRPLSATDLEPPRIVTRNQLVTIVYAVPGLTLTTQGRALGEAALGQTVSVSNLRSNRIVQAVAKGPGQVTVEAGVEVAQR